MNDLFNKPNVPVFDENKDYWKEYVGEGGKFYDPDETVAKQKIAKGKAHADFTIKMYEERADLQRQEYETLKGDYLNLKKDYESRAKIEELLDRVNGNREDNHVNNPNDRVELPIIDESKIEDLFSRKITQYEAEKKEQANFDYTLSELKKRYGENYQSALERHSAELDLSTEDVNFMARTKPKALLQMLPKPQAETFDSPIPSNRRSDNFSPSTTKRTWSYWQKIRKEDPQFYASPKATVQRLEDAKNLGEEFKDGNFHQI